MDATQRLAVVVESSYEGHQGYRHAFWNWIAKGEFKIETLREFALMYYEHVKVFRLYLAGAMTIMPTERLQIVLARILADEFGLVLDSQGVSMASHPELFRGFMRSIGLTSIQWSNSHLIDGISYFRDVHYALFRGGLVAETLGAVIFGFEKTTPHRHGQVVAGLRRFQALSGAHVDDRFFAEHVTVDPSHSGALVEALLECDPPIDIERLTHGARISFDARKVFLDDLAAQLGIRL